MYSHNELQSICNFIYSELLLSFSLSCLYEPRHEKHVCGVCDQVRHKPACAATEARKRLEISDIETRGIILSRQRTTKALIRLRGCRLICAFVVRI